MNNTVKQCSIEDFFLKTNSKENYQIIDVRENYEYETVHIENSKLFPLSCFDENILKIDKTKPAYMLCGVGKRAMVAAEKLITNGFQDVIVIDGGIKAWIEKGYPVIA